MNDLELEKQLRAAFDEVNMPADLRERTLAAIEAARKGEGEGAGAAADGRAGAAMGERAAAAEVAGAVETAGDNTRKLRVRKNPLRFACGIAACLVVALAGFFGYRSVLEPTAFIDIDINPSIELAVNRFDTVVGLEALNGDAQAVVEQVDVVGKPYDEAIAVLMEEVSRAGYSLDDSYLEFSISSDDAQQTVTLENSTDSFMAACGYAGNCNAVDSSVHEAAHACNMGVGKYLAAQELANLDPSITVEDCAHMSMRQIRDGISACHQQAGESSGENVSGAGAGAGGYGAGAGTGTGSGGTNGANGSGYGAGEGGHHGYGGNGAGAGQGNGYRHHHAE